MCHQLFLSGLGVEMIEYLCLRRKCEKGESVRYEWFWVVRGSPLLGVLLLCLLLQIAAAEPPRIQIPRASKAPALEDVLGGASASAGAMITDFRQYNPHDGEPTSRETRAYLSYDSDNLYALFVCKDEPDNIRARISKREDIFNDDMVTLYVDTFHDRQRMYTFSSNPLGIQADLIFTEGQRPNLAFDTLWYSKGQLTADGYVVWMAIPFKSLRFPRSAGQSWGIALGRGIIRNNEFSYWPYITPRVRSFVSQLATLEPLDQVSRGHNVQVMPYLTFTHARIHDDTDQGAKPLEMRSELRGGFDAKLIWRDSVSIDIAVSPDFSQVESDEPQVTINQRFEVFFPEKRPFFLENAGFFLTPENLFFSRRVMQPSVGIRMTGKAGVWNVGGLMMNDRGTGESPVGGDSHAWVGVARVQREFGKQSSIGFLGTGRATNQGANEVLSFDARLNLNPNWTLTGQLAKSWARGLVLGKPVGTDSFVELSHNGRHFNYVSQYVDRSPGFRSDVGFIPRVDIRQTVHSFDYRVRPKHSLVASFGPSFSALSNWDREGRVQDWQAVVGFGIDLVRKTALSGNHAESFERFQDHGFRKESSGLTLSSDWFKSVGIATSYNHGAAINFFPAAGLQPFLGTSDTASARVTLRPRPGLQIDNTYLYSRLGAQGLSSSQTPAERIKASVFNNHLLRSKLNYQFTRRLALRAILDYSAVLPNAALVNLDRSKKLTTDFLVTYFVHPGTALYVGYTDKHENVFFNATTSTLVNLPTPSFRMTTARQVFFKVSYLFRL